MKLEQAIKQKTPFKSQRQRAAVNLFFTNNWLISAFKEELKPFGITQQQYNVLRILRGQYPNPISTSDIRSRMLDRMSDVSRIVDRLVKKELVIRKVCKSDKRLVDVVISESGLKILQDMDDFDQPMEELMRNLSDEELEQLNDLLDKLRG